MSDRNTIARTMHDVGLAAWFGGTLMGAVGVNGAAADVDDPRQRARVASAGWARWTPWNAAAIGAHLIGAVQMLRANSDRVRSQQGVATSSAVKTGLTVAALGATGYSRILGQKVMAAGDVPVAGGTSPLPTTPPEVAKAQKQLKVVQWAIPGLTGALLSASAFQGEQMKPSQVASGAVQRFTTQPVKGAVQKLPGSGSQAAGLSLAIAAIPAALAVKKWGKGSGSDSSRPAVTPVSQTSTVRSTPSTAPGAVRSSDDLSDTGRDTLGQPRVGRDIGSV